MNRFKAIWSLRRAPRLRRIITDSQGLINTTDLLVATAATVVLSAGIGGAAVSTLNEAKYGKAQPDATIMANAITDFYKDTGKWPGQAYHALNQTQTVLLATGTYVSSTSSTFTLPQVSNNGLKWGTTTTCAANSSEGFVNGTVKAFASSSTSTALTVDKVLNINDYLVRQPDSVAYPGWKGPYVQEISNDPWDRAWVAYLAPLYCSEDLTVAGVPAATGNIGYAWLVSGGSNRTVTTPATLPNLDPAGDDTGVIMGKLVVRKAPVSGY